jgi:hypothetical protein
MYRSVVYIMRSINAHYLFIQIKCCFCKSVENRENQLDLAAIQIDDWLDHHTTVGMHVHVVTFYRD